MCLWALSAQGSRAHSQHTRLLRYSTDAHHNYLQLWPIRTKCRYIFCGTLMLVCGPGRCQDFLNCINCAWPQLAIHTPDKRNTLLNTTQVHGSLGPFQELAAVQCQYFPAVRNEERVHVAVVSWSCHRHRAGIRIAYDSGSCRVRTGREGPRGGAGNWSLHWNRPMIQDLGEWSGLWGG